MAGGGTPGPAHVQFDTSGIAGDPDGADVGASKPTAYRASVADTGGPQGGTRTEPGSPAVTKVDTSGTDGVNTSFTPVSTAMTGTPSTLNPGAGGGVPETNPAYRAPGGPVSAGNLDTTRTADQPGGSTTNPVPSSQTVTNIETANIGATGTTIGLAPVAPGSAPTVATGPRYITVTWVAVADPSGDPVREYVIENDRGGRWVAGRNATSDRIDYVDPSQTYKFRVAARNKAGIGPFSAFSAAVRSYNPDAPDVLKPAGVTAEAVAAGIYTPQGTLKAGTGGTNNAPGIVSATAGAAASKTITVVWTAPTVGDAPTSYLLTASNGATTTSAAGTTSKAFVFAAAGASVTITVQAINAKGAGIVSAATPARTIP